MGSSYRDDLNRGHMPEWEAKLRIAGQNIEEVITDSLDATDGESQFDNAADDGALRACLGVALNLIRAELPVPKEKPKQEEA